MKYARVGGMLSVVASETLPKIDATKAGLVPAAFISALCSGKMQPAKLQSTFCKTAKPTPYSF